MAATASARNVDFSNVKDGGNFNRKRIPAGDYLAKIIKVEDAPAKDETPQYLFSIKIEKIPSSVLPYYCKLQENQLWKLRNIMIAAGKAVPKKRMKVDPNTIVGKLIGVSIEDDEYENKDQSSVAGVFPAAELGEVETADDEPIEDDEDEDEDDSPSVQFEDAEEEDEEEDEEPAPAMTRAELKAAITALNPKFVARKSQTDADLATILADLQAGDAEDDEEEEDDEPAPAPTPKKKVTKKPVNEVTDDELEELDIDNL